VPRSARLGFPIRVGDEITASYTRPDGSVISVTHLVTRESSHSAGR
jgi:hypothetical protein